MMLHNQQFAYCILIADSEYKHFPYNTEILWLAYHKMLEQSRDLVSEINVFLKMNQ